MRAFRKPGRVTVGRREKMNPSAFRRDTDLPEYILRIIFDAMFLRQRNEFLFVGHFAVIRLLIPDITRNPNNECTVPEILLSAARRD